MLILFLAAFSLLTGPAQAVERGALFKVSGHDHTMYLFGTIHVGLPEFYPLDESVTRALAASTTLALENDQPAQTAEGIAAAQRTVRTTPAIVAAMPSALGPRLARRLEAMHAPATLSTQLKPWMLVMTLSIFEYTKLGYRPDLGVDAQLAKLAHGQNIKVIGLETVESQLAVLDSLSAADQWTLVDETLASLDSGETQQNVQTVTNGWAKADHTALDALALKFEMDPRLWGQILERRLLT
jgi:uncharacterized protein YbaP (TraB family)